MFIERMSPVGKLHCANFDIYATELEWVVHQLDLGHQHETEVCEMG